MSKPKTEKNWEGVAQARAKHVPIPARKARLVLDLIRGKSVDEALRILAFTKKPSAVPVVTKLLRNAAACAKTTANLSEQDVSSLRVSEVYADGAAMLKRLRPAPMGRGVRVRKRSCHITLRLDS